MSEADRPPGITERGRRTGNDDAAILGFDVAGVSRPPADPAERPRRLIARARERYEAGEFQAAIGFADQALALDPQYPPAWLWKAYSLKRLGNLEGAVAELNRAGRTLRDPEAVRRVEEKRDAYRRILTGRPLEEARCLLRDGRPGPAVTILEKVAGTLAAGETCDDHLTYAREQVAAAQARGPVPGSALSLAAMQRVLTWLNREETTEGDRALAAEDHQVAARWFALARRRDNRHTAAALGEATAVYAMARAGVARASRVPHRVRSCPRSGWWFRRSPRVAGRLRWCRPSP